MMTADDNGLVVILFLSIVCKIWFPWALSLKSGALTGIVKSAEHRFISFFSGGLWIQETNQTSVAVSHALLQQQSVKGHVCPPSQLSTGPHGMYTFKESVSVLEHKMLARFWKDVNTPSFPLSSFLHLLQSSSLTFTTPAPCSCDVPPSLPL